jgi:zinc transport system permease protein
VCSTLFGSTAILTLSRTDVWLCIVLSGAVVLLFTVFYHQIFAVTFDETFARASGMKADRYNLLIAVVTASVIVLAMKLVGSLLISALLIFPALSAMRIFRSFRGVILASAVLSVICAAAGILLSILFSTPVGATVVCMDMAVFALCSLAGGLLSRG